jgi:predicted AAA+ superfamily ATPase
MLHKLRLLQKEFLKKIDNYTYQRYIFNDINLKNKLIGIQGARGVGKTIFLLQYLKNSSFKMTEKLYISADFMGIESLFDIAFTFSKEGGKLLIIDEVHKVNNFEQQLKNIYDALDLQVIFSGSSALQIDNAKADLSRRAIVYTMEGLSFREFLELKYNIRLDTFSLNEIVSNHINIAYELSDKFNPYTDYREYVKYGYYPFYFENKDDYLIKLHETVNVVIQNDIPTIFSIDFHKVILLKKLVTLICQSNPYQPNIKNLLDKLELKNDYKTLYKYLHYLHKGKIINIINPKAKGDGIFTKPQKLYLNNTNLHFAYCDNSEIGTVREVFFMSMLFNHTVSTPNKGDFLVDDKYLFEVGGKGKSFKQIKDIKNSFIAADDIEIGSGNKIPLWLFGFLY